MKTTTHEDSSLNTCLLPPMRKQSHRSKPLAVRSSRASHPASVASDQT